MEQHLAFLTMTFGKNLNYTIRFWTVSSRWEMNLFGACYDSVPIAYGKYSTNIADIAFPASEREGKAS